MFFFTPSLDSILKGFTKTIDQLENLAVKKMEESIECSNQIADLTKQKKDALEDVKNAQAIRGRLKTIFERGADTNG